MYKQLNKINSTPKPYEFYTAQTLWTDKHISKKMLEYHLNPDIDPASRNQAFIKNSIDWMIRRFNIGKGIKIADFGCGPGFYTSAFAENGASVVGIDFSELSITYAQKQAELKKLSIQYVNKNYLNFKSDERFNLITLIYCDLCPLSPQQRQILLTKFYRHLESDGIVLLDVFSLAAFKNRHEIFKVEHLLLNGFWSADDYYVFLKTIKYDKENVILDKYRIIEKSREWEIYNWLQYYSKKSLSEEFSENGFQIEEYYSDLAGTPFQPESETIAIAAKKI